MFTSTLSRLWLLEMWVPGMPSPVEPSGVMIQLPAAAIHPTSFGACGHLAAGLLGVILLTFHQAMWQFFLKNGRLMVSKTEY